MTASLSRLAGLVVAALCVAAGAVSPSSAEPRVIADDTGRQVAVEDISRVVSLGGSVTEILYALGLQYKIAAIDVTSTYPPQALGEHPNVGYLRTLSAEGVLSVSPSLILAEEDAGPPHAIELLQKASVPILRVPSDMTAEGVVAKVRFIADVMGVPEKGAELADALAVDFAALERQLAGKRTSQRVLFVLSLADGRIMAAGADTAADAVMKLAGAENALAGFSRYKPVNSEAVLAAAPDAIVVMARDGDGPGPGVAVPDVLADPTLGQTPAGKAGKVIAMNGLYLLGFGPRTAHAAHDLAAALYPDLRLPTLAARRWTDTETAPR
jgi:iron complex transport system substrate-binding protein